MRVDLEVERGADLVLAASRELGPGVRVRLSGESGSAKDLDTGWFSVRSITPVTWGDMQPGSYRIRHEGIGGEYLDRVFSLVAGERFDYSMSP